jgi:peroxiredoxin Q/BCP
MANPQVQTDGQLREGDEAPNFSMPTDSEDTVTLANYRGKNLVLYFYPKDDTPGCTIEGKDFSALKEQFDATNTAILGVSKDGVDKHKKFVEKHCLTIPLGADDNSDVCEKYGVWVEKNMYGKKYMGIERTTFLINAEGNIAKIWRKVKVKGHAEEVLEAAKGL